MKQVKIELNIDPEKFKATKQFMAEKGLKIETELCSSVTKLYEKNVPAAVRRYIEAKASNIPSPGTAKQSESASKSRFRDLEAPVLRPESADFDHDQPE